MDKNQPDYTVGSIKSQLTRSLSGVQEAYKNPLSNAISELFYNCGYSLTKINEIVFKNESTNQNIHQTYIQGGSK